MVLPLPLVFALNAMSGLVLGLLGAPLLAVAWVGAMSVADWALQRIYGHWQTRSEQTDSDTGLRRLGCLVGLRSSLWLAGPVAYTLMSHSPIGILQTAVTAFGLVAISVSSGWTSRAVSTGHAGPAAVAILVEAWVLASPLQLLGLGLGLAVFGVTMTMISVGTHRAVTEWSESHRKLLGAKAAVETALRRSEATERRLGIAISITDLYVYEVDYTAETFTHQSDGADLFGTRPTFEQLRDDPFSTVHPDDRPAVAAAWERAEAADGRFRIEYRADLGGEDETWVFAVAEMYRDQDGNPLKLVGALQNITERKLAELNLIHARDAAEAANTAKSNFLSNMSHEIRTPLNGVLGMVQAMLVDGMEPVQRNRLNVIRDSGETLLSILNAVLDIAKIEAGKMELEIGEFDIVAVVKKALDPFVVLASQKDIALTFDVRPSAEGFYRGDPTRVGQILHNLISNAVKFTEAGAVSVVVDRADDHLVLTVEDTGAGIDPSQKQALFEKFKQADASVTRRFGGTGLGLAIVSELAALMGGSVDVEGQVGVGSRFRVVLALEHLADLSSAPDGEPATAQAPATVLPPLRILVAEDNEINRLVIRTLLNQVGVDPTMVIDGALAVAAWEAADWDLILMDVQMPNMDGSAAARAIRSREAALNRDPVPIIALTANVMEHQVSAYLDAGMNNVLAKPIDAARLFTMIEETLAQAEEAAAVAQPGRFASIQD